MNDISFNASGGPYLPLAARDSDQPAAPADGTRVPLVTQYLRILVRWRWLVIGSVVVALLLGIVLTLLATPQYTATTRVEINREGSRIVDVEDVTPEASAVDNEFYQTQYGLLRSRAMAERVVRELRLAEDQSFFEMFSAEGTLPEGGSAAARAERSRIATDILLEHVSVEPLRLSRLVDIGFESPDPALSARVANAWATSFIEYNLERRFEASSYARRFLEQRLEQLRGRLEESERQLVGYASNQALINVPTGSADADGRPQERSLTVETLGALNAELARATADRVRAESRLRAAGASTAEALSNNAITGLRQRRAEAAAEYGRLLTQFEPGYPPAEALQAQIRQLDQAISREEARVSGSLRGTYEDSVRRERDLSARVEQLKGEFLDQRRRSIQYNIFQRDVDTNRELYNGLLQRYKEIGVAGGVGENNIAIVDTARVPEKPSSPRPLINILISLLGGLVLGFGLAFVREQIDETIVDPTDIERRLGLPLLGAVPVVSGDEPINALHDPKSPVIEAYHSVQTSLAFSSDHGVPRTLVVTSTRPAEGKSTTAFALAYVLARNGARVILVDADMRSPSVHGEVGLSNDRGLSTYLAGTSDLAGLIQQPEREPFAIMAAGPQPPNAAELLRSDRLDMVFQELLRSYDKVIIDSPPVMGLADAPLIASRAEGTVYVVAARGVRARLALVAIGRLRQARAKILGTVLSKFESRQAHYGYGYDYGYGYGEQKSA